MAGVTGSRKPSGVALSEAEGKVRPSAGILDAMPPPEYADRLITRWKELGCPPIGLGQGITITNLERWLYPFCDFTRSNDQLGIVLGFLYPGQGRFEDLQGYLPASDQGPWHSPPQV